ncbi:hypothetical protein PMAYCL1PPCAC_01503, partial [Pristionchus mayeri]
DEIKEEPIEFKDEPIDEFADIKQEEPVLNPPYQMTEELIEIKEEPVDEFAEIKQEEPMTDIFCPSTGNSRPLHQTSSMESKLVGRQVACGECGKKLSSMDGLKRHMLIHSERKLPSCT